jgi:uncharacterized protein YxjI
MPPSDRVDHPFSVPKAADTKQPRFLVREAHLPIGDDYVIELDPGGRAYVVDGKLLSARESLTIKNIDGDEVLHLQGTFLGARKVLAVSRHGDKVVTVRRQEAEAGHQAPEAGHDEYVVELPDGESVEVVGNPADRKYELRYRGHVVATIAHAWMPLTSGYRVQIASGQDDGVVLAVTVCLDVISRH